jgi:hypothetical protein
MCGRLGTSRCMFVIYRSRKKKERCKVTVSNHGKVNLNINGKKKGLSNLGGK